MQDKETVDNTKETLTGKAEPVSDNKNDESKKESSKDNKFAFRKMKTPKKEKPEKKSVSKYEGEGVIFKAKLIGVESVPDPRGDKMCQDAMQRLKMNVRNTGPHKRKINVCVSLQGIKIKDEKMTSEIFHHPVPKISFISQDITDARAFGYVFGSTDEPHQFIAIKTEKAAFHVVLALRDLFQAVLNHKQEDHVKGPAQELPVSQKKAASKAELDPSQSMSIVPSISELNVLLQNKIKQDGMSTAQIEQKANEENFYVEVLATEPLEVKDEELVDTKTPEPTVDTLLDLESEQNMLKQGIAAAAAFNAELALPDLDPFDTSFVLGGKRNSMPVPLSIPIALVSPIVPNGTRSASFNGQGLSTDKYAVFNAFNESPSVFEMSAPEYKEEDQLVPELKDLEEEIAKKSVPPAKPPRISKSSSPDTQNIFADLDPLGKDRPFVDKTEFFQDVKNPPKKVLNDLVDLNKESRKNSDANSLSSSVPFPVDFESMSSSFANSTIPSNPFEKQNGVVPNGISYNETQSNSKSSPTNPCSHQLTVNCNIANLNQNMSSSPIPIPPRHPGVFKDRSSSNGSLGSPYSKSPQPYSSDSPDQTGYYIQNYSDSDSPTGYKNGDSQQQFANDENGYAVPKQKVYTQNGMSRPRPRPSLGKVTPTPNGLRTFSSHSLSSDSSSDYDVISRDSMQSITNMLVTNGHRLRAQSLYIEANDNKLLSEKTIFTKKMDPFADDFFVPKKNNHFSNKEIPECV